MSQRLPVVFPIRPRTHRRIADFGLDASRHPRLILLEPLGYLEFLALQRDAKVVVTDSGGIQEETTYLGVPCLTVRENTERPVTVQVGTNQLVGQDMERLKLEVENILSGRAKRGTIPPLWDGKAGERVADVILRVQSHRNSYPW